MGEGSMHEGNISLMTTVAEAFHVVHNEVGTKARAACIDEIHLQGPGDGVGPNNVATALTMWNGIKTMLGGKV
jgi:hypothetical protein